MKLFKIEVKFKHRRRSRYGVDTIVHAKSKAEAEAYVRGKFPACTIERTIALAGSVPKHFIIADLVDE